MFGVGDHVDGRDVVIGDREPEGDAGLPARGPGGSGACVDEGWLGGASAPDLTECRTWLALLCRRRQIRRRTVASLTTAAPGSRYDVRRHRRSCGSWPRGGTRWWGWVRSAPPSPRRTPPGAATRSGPDRVRRRVGHRADGAGAGTPIVRKPSTTRRAGHRLRTIAGSAGASGPGHRPAPHRDGPLGGTGQGDVEQPVAHRGCVADHAEIVQPFMSSRLPAGAIRTPGRPRTPRRPRPTPPTADAGRAGRDPDRREHRLAHPNGRIGRAADKESHEPFTEQPKVGVPTAVTVFPGYHTVRPVADRERHVVQRNEYDRGGHFAALQAPDLLLAEVRAFAHALPGASGTTHG